MSALVMPREDAQRLRDRVTEDRLVGTALQWGEHLDLLIEAGLHADHFASVHTRLTWEACHALWREGHVPTPFGAWTWLGDHGHAAAVDRCWLFGVGDGCPRPTRDVIVAATQRLARLAAARRLVAHTRALLDRVTETPMALAEHLAQYRQQLETLTTTAQPRAELPLEDAVDVAREGRALATQGVAYLVDGLVPQYGLLGFSIAYAKVGKTTLAHLLAAAVATGTPFLGRRTQATKVLLVAAEDPPEYTAWLARHLEVPPQRISFLRQPWIAEADRLAALADVITREGYGLVLMASWQAIVRGLIRDENDNAGAVAVVERIKATVRATGIPWIIDAHAGKGEDQRDDADPARALRGASAAAGAADFLWSLRYAEGAFSPRRRLSAKGRFVSVAPITFAYDAEHHTVEVIGACDQVMRETTFRLLLDQDAITETPRTIAEIAQGLGWAEGGRIPAAKRRHLMAALADRPGILRREVIRRGQRCWAYFRCPTVSPSIDETVETVDTVATPQPRA